MYLKIKVTLTFFIFCFVVYIHADTIYLKNGNILSGIIKDEARDKVIIDVGLQEIKIPLEQIDRIEKQDESENAILEINILLENNQINDALNKYNFIINKKYNNDSVKLKSYLRVLSNILVNQENILGKIDKLKNNETKNIIQNLFSSIRQNKFEEDIIFDEYFYFEMKCYLLFNDIENALNSFMQISTDKINIDEEKKLLMSKVLKDKIRNLLFQNKYEESLEFIEYLNRINPQAGHNCQILIYLDWGRSEKNAGNYESAIKIYLDELKPISPYIANDRIRDVLDRIIQEAIESNDYTEAIKLWKDYGNGLFPEESQVNLAKLFYLDGIKLYKNNKFKEARMSFQLSDKYKESEDVKREIARCDYQITLLYAPPQDSQTHYRLAEFCLDNKLIDEAIEQFGYAATSAELKENALAKIDIIKEQQQISMFKSAMKLYEEEKYTQSLDMIYEILKRFKDLKLRQEINNLKDLIQKNIQSEGYKRIYQSDIFYQEAERLFFLGNYTKALDKCDIILSEYSTTPAAERAKLLRPKIQSNIKLNLVETSDFKVQLDDSKTTSSFVLNEEQSQIEKEIQNILGFFEEKN